MYFGDTLSFNPGHSTYVTTTSLRLHEQIRELVYGELRERLGVVDSILDPEKRIELSQYTGEKRGEVW